MYWAIKGVYNYYKTVVVNILMQKLRTKNNMKQAHNIRNGGECVNIKKRGTMNIDNETTTFSRTRKYNINNAAEVGGREV